MRLKINNKKSEVDFWDFVLNVFLAELTIIGLFWLSIFILAICSLALFG
tara:strand:- start:60 stop:206 length:147 start_codon:yes stop_codon:yes gene_type:complete